MKKPRTYIDATKLTLEQERPNDETVYVDKTTFTYLDGTPAVIRVIRDGEGNYFLAKQQEFHQSGRARPKALGNIILYVLLRHHYNNPRVIDRFRVGTFHSPNHNWSIECNKKLDDKSGLAIELDLRIRARTVRKCNELLEQLIEGRQRIVDIQRTEREQGGDLQQ